MARPKGSVTYTDAQITEAIKAAKGILASAANALGCSRATIYNAIERNPAIKAVYADESEKVIDFVESKLLDRINKGDTTAMIFFLKTKGKSRGYVERIESTGKDGGAIEIKVIYDDSLPSDS